MTTFRPAGESDSDEYSDDAFGGADDHREQAGANGDYYASAGASNGQTTTTGSNWRQKAFGSGSSSAPRHSRMTADMHNATSVSLEDRFKEAVLLDDVSAVARFLDEGFPMEKTFQGLDCAGTPLVIACSHGCANTVRLLLERGACNEPDETGITPLMTVCMAKVEVEKYGGTTEARLVECARHFLRIRKKEEEVDVNRRQNQRMTPLMLASKQGHPTLVQFLIEEGAQVDLQDSQEWTALCFAADQGCGRVVRVLLEAEADPGLATRDGMLASELAASRGQEKLQELIEKFERRKSLLRGDRTFGGKRKGAKKFSELDNVLMGLDLGCCMDQFERHKVSLEDFLSLSNEDLEKIGVDEVGVRKKLLGAITEIHKKDWEKTSLPRITPREKQRGIYFTCPDCVSTVSNMGEHAKFLNASAKFIHKQLVEHPEILQYGQDIANVSQLRHHVQKCGASLRTLMESVRRLNRVVARLEANPALTPVDLVKPESRFSLVKAALFPTAVIVVAGAVYIALCFRKM